MTYEEQARRQAAGLVGRDYLAPITAKPKLTKGESHVHRRRHYAAHRLRFNVKGTKIYVKDWLGRYAQKVVILEGTFMSISVGQQIGAYNGPTHYFKYPQQYCRSS